MRPARTSPGCSGTRWPGRWATRRLDPSAPGLADGPERELADVLVVEADYAQSEQVRRLVRERELPDELVRLLWDEWGRRRDATRAVPLGPSARQPAAATPRHSTIGG